ncbi:MAG: response regulator [Syntrophotaleaceae bacterium]
MSKKVLLADDSVTIQKVVEIILADGDYDLLIADNGDAALNKAQTDRPDIVLADVYMPGMDGYQLCAAVKQDAALSGIPVLLLSGTFEAFDESKALAAGADGWIAKPFESQALLEQIDELLARPVAAAAWTEGTDAVSIGEAAPAVSEPDMWADIELDTLAEDETEEFLVDAAAQDGDEVELEADSLWDEEPLLDSDDQPVALADEEDVEVGEIDFSGLAEPPAGSDELSLADETAETAEEVLFLDESDLLIEDDAAPVAIEDEETLNSLPWKNLVPWQGMLPPRAFGSRLL